MPFCRKPAWARYLVPLNGDEVLKEIRQTIGDQKTTIVMATSKSDRKDVQACIDLGIEGYVVKPFPLREIGSKILTYYAKKEPERATIAEALNQETLNQSPMRLIVDGKTETITGE